jgi:HEAT repeat protein
MRIGEKKRIVALLGENDIEMILSELQILDARDAVNPLFAGICNGSETVRWHAINAMGPTVAKIAAQDMEQARIVMRRLMWSLNDESGGIGWGAPESLAEIMATHNGMAEEYAHIPISYMREDGNYLEHPTLQRGVLWGIGRLADARADLMQKYHAPRYLIPYLDSEDAPGRGLAARALGILKEDSVLEKLRKLIDDSQEVRLYWNRDFSTLTVGDMASQAIANILVP